MDDAEFHLSDYEYLVLSIANLLRLKSIFKETLKEQQLSDQAKRTVDLIMKTPIPNLEKAYLMTIIIMELEKSEKIATEFLCVSRQS